MKEQCVTPKCDGKPITHGGGYCVVCYRVFVAELNRHSRMLASRPRRRVRTQRGQGFTPAQPGRTEAYLRGGH